MVPGCVLKNVVDTELIYQHIWNKILILLLLIYVHTNVLYFQPTNEYYFIMPSFFPNLETFSTLHLNLVKKWYFLLDNYFFE